MINEDYVSYEVAKLLKEKGFPIMCHVGSLWVDKQGKTKLHSTFAPITWVNKDDDGTPAVSQALAMKWMREEHNIIITPQPEYFSCDRCESWGVDIWAFDNYEKLPGDFPTYEEAIEAALKYSLENLI